MERRHGSRPQRVLVVDDSADMREMWRACLTHWGFAVEEAADGADAVRIARLNPPDLVLMDVWMPVKDGLQTTRELKADPATASVPVLALSADHSAHAVQEAKLAGCAMFLGKPLTPDELLEKIRISFGIVRGSRES